jgi:hypothetical protein
MLPVYLSSCRIQLHITVKQHSQFTVCEQTSSESSVLQQQDIKTQLINLVIIVKNIVVQYLKQKKQDVFGDDNLLHFSLKTLCFTGIYPYENVCNTPRRLKLFHAYRITLFLLYCPILFSYIF